MDTFQNVERFGLIVYGVERRDQVKGFGLGGIVEVAQITDDELDISQTPLRASSRAIPIASGERSIPVNRLLGIPRPTAS